MLPRQPQEDVTNGGASNLESAGELMRRREQARNVAEIAVAKNRHGRTGTARVFADMATARFADLSPRGPY